MNYQDSKQALWANISKLMIKKYGKENLTQFAKDVGVGPGTATRIKEQKTSVGTEIIDKVAETFDVPPWELLSPDFEPGHGSKSALWPFEEITPAQFNQLSERKKGAIEARALDIINEAEVGRGTARAV